MDNYMCSIILCLCLAVTIADTTTTPRPTLKCRFCGNAMNLGDCNKEAPCAPNEYCYMEQVVTISQQVVYNGGCRAADICRGSASGIVGRSDSVISCSRCCDDSPSCNAHLCGIPDMLLNASNCYYCDDGSTQSGLSSPSECSTLTVCQHDEVCYVGKEVIAGQPRYVWGCKSRRICELLMGQMFQEWDRCNANPTVLGCIQHRTLTRATSVCYACCGYGGCNNGTCDEVIDQLYQLYKAGQLDVHTLRPIT